MEENNIYRLGLQGREKQPMFNVPMVVVVLIGSFLVVHAIRNLVPVEWNQWLMLTFAFIPVRYSDLPELTGVVWPGGLGAQIWTFVTHGFLHGDWFHVLVNSVWMLAFGSVVARRFGWKRFLAFSAIAAASGAAANLALHWNQAALLIGASGAISGHMAGAIRLMYSMPRGLANMQAQDFSAVRVLSLGEFFQVRSAVIFIVVWMVLNFVLGISGFGTGENINSIAWEAHVGGFVFGLIFFGVFDRRQTS